MTTTPDSRIAHDWHLDALPGPESTSLPPGVPTRAQAGHLVDQMTPELRAEMEDYWARAEAPIDTSTTAGKIAVMQAYERGEAVQARHLGLAEWSVPKTRKDTGDDPCWDWSMYDYRIAPPPAPRTALQLAREFRTGIKTVDVTSPAGRLCALLSQIDNSIVVTIEHFKLPHYGATKPEDLQPGRYRLLRDDA